MLSLKKLRLKSSLVDYSNLCLEAMKSKLKKLQLKKQMKLTTLKILT